MNIKKLWKSLFKKTDSDETPAAAQVWQPLVGSNMSSAFAEIPEVYQSILFISTNATQAELGYFRFKDNAEVYRDNPQVRPLSELLDRPNPEMDLNTFWEFVYGFLAYYREVFILKVKSRGQLAGTRNLPAQLWPVNPKECVAVSFDAWGVSAWSIKGMIYPAEDVIHIRYFNPVDMFRSVSPLTPLDELIKANKAAMKSNRAFYENNSQAPFILATDRDLTKTQMDVIKDAWEAGHKGSEKRGNTGFLSGGLKPYAINTNNGTAEFVENSKNTSERILSGLQMQKALLNMTDTTNYATYMGQLRTFWQNVIRPMVRKVESALNASVVRPFAPELELRFKYDNVEAFQADFAEKVKTAQMLASIGYPINKISDRLNLGFEPVAWGDDWWINFGLVPASDYRAGVAPQTRLTFFIDKKTLRATPCKKASTPSRRPQDKFIFIRAFYNLSFLGRRPKPALLFFIAKKVSKKASTPGSHKIYFYPGILQLPTVGQVKCLYTPLKINFIDGFKGVH